MGIAVCGTCGACELQCVGVSVCGGVTSGLRCGGVAVCLSYGV